MARILLAEDDADIRALLRFRLSLDGHEVTAVNDGAAAVAACSEHVFDLLVSDVSMPHLSGLEVTRWIRTQSATPSLPIILLTAFTTPEDRQRGLEAGADDYFGKPVVLAELAARVNELAVPG